MPSKDKYTDPKLRDEIKEEIHNSDKGGAPGQWSARKAQMMASEYKKRGGDYNTDKSEKDESQKHLDNWGEEDWQTKDGSGNAKKEDGTQQRYLPKKAWENMTEEEKEKTDKKKQEGSKEGKQYVENTDKAKNSRKKAQKDDDGEEEVKEDDEESEENDDKENDEKKTQKASAKNSKKQDDKTEKAESKAKNTKKDEKNSEEDGGDEGDEEYVEEDEDQDEHEEEDDNDNDNDNDNSNSRKRKDSPQQGEKDAPSPKKQKSSSSSSSKKTVGSKHMPADEPAARGSADRLPSKGDKVTWKAMPGYVDGEVMEIVTSNKNVDGKSVKATKDDPKIVLKSASSGKICVHKPDACFYD